MTVKLIDASGFKKPTYPEILQELKDLARAKYGEDVNMSSHTPLGKLLEIIAYREYLMIEDIEDLYNSKFIHKADGQALVDELANWLIYPREPKYANGELLLEVERGAVIKKGALFRGGNANGLYQAVKTYRADAEGELVIRVESLEIGDAGNAHSHTINTIVTPMRGVESATNPLPFLNGQDAETDEELRERHKVSRSIQGSRRLAAIEANILQDVDGIKSALVLENDTMVERDGIPPKTIHTIYAGGEGEEVAKVVLRLKAGGIQAFGKTVYDLKDERGATHEIGVTEAEERSVWVRVKVLTRRGIDADMVEKAIYQHVGGFYKGELYRGLKMGETLYSSQLEGAVGCLSGDVLDITVEVSTDGEIYERVNLELENYEVWKLEGVEVIVEERNG